MSTAPKSANTIAPRQTAALEGRSITQITEFPNSKHRDDDVCAFLERALIRRNLDVAVRRGEAGDVSRPLEGGVGGAVAQTDRVELVPAYRGHDATAEWNTERARCAHRQTGDRAQVRHEPDVRVRQAGCGIAGHAEERRACAHPAGRTVG